MKRRTFPKRVYRSILRRQRMKCRDCGNKLVRGNIAFDHGKPLWLGGTDTPDDLGAICQNPCHAIKTRREAKERAKIKRQIAKAAGTWRPKRKKIANRGFPKAKRKLRPERVDNTKFIGGDAA